MFSSYTQGQDVKTPPLPHDGSRTKTSHFLSDPSALCTRFTVTNEEALERVHYTIQDTPGFGDDTDICRSIDLILNYIDESNKVGRRRPPSLPLSCDFHRSLRVAHVISLIFLRSLPPSLPPSLPLDLPGGGKGQVTHAALGADTGRGRKGGRVSVFLGGASAEVD